MSIKAGEMIHVGNNIVVDRAQTGGISALNQPTDRVYELGNYQSVGTIRDVPDLTFGLESFDSSAALEALLHNLDNTAASAGTIYDLGTCQYMDVLSQFKKGRTNAAPFDVAGSLVVPFLGVESVSYKFGMHDNASQTVSLRGDSLFYAEGSAFLQTAAGSGTAAQTVLLAHHALPYNGDFIAGKRYALSVELVNAGRRLIFGNDYTETHTGTDPSAVVTLHIVEAVDVSETIRITYQSKDTVANYPQSSNLVASTTKPSAIRGKDITVLLGAQGSTLDPIANRITGVQTFSADWKVTLQKDEEFGNSQSLGEDYDVPDVSGAVGFKPINYHDFMEKIRLLAGLASGADEIVGPYQVVPLQMAAILHSPYDGSVLKTLYSSDARFTLPTAQGKVQTKWQVDLPWASDGGILKVSKGLYPFP